MSIWVLKDGQREGPYEEQDIRELIYEGTYTGDDPAIRGGQFDWTTLGQLLNREPVEEAEADEVVEPPPMPTDLVGTPVEAVATEVGVAVLPAGVTDGAATRVEVVDIRMPFGSVLTLMFKWVLAWMLVMVVLGGVAAMVWTILLLMMVGMTRR
jgi:hypothetical protein